MDIEGMNSSFAEYVILQSKIEALEKENAALKAAASTAQQTSSVVASGNYQAEENIARIQLALLDRESMSRELTLEEAKKCEIYAKIINSSKKNVKDVDAEVRNLDTSKLLESIGS